MKCCTCSKTALVLNLQPLALFHIMIQLSNMFTHCYNFSQNSCLGALAFIFSVTASQVLHTVQITGSEVISSQERFCSITVMPMKSVGTVCTCSSETKYFHPDRNCSITGSVIWLCCALCSASQQVAASILVLAGGWSGSRAPPVPTPGS